MLPCLLRRLLMKKALSVFAVLLMLICLCSCKSKNKAEPETTSGTVTTTFPYTYETHTLSPDDTPEKIEASSVPNATVAPSGGSHQQAPQSTKPPVSKDGVVTYYSDNPNNKYIKTVADKFGSDPSNLVALIKTNAQYPGASVLEFDGTRNADGSLVTTTETLRYIYDVQDSGVINKSNKDGTDTYGYNRLSGMTAYMLAEKYMVPSLDNYRQNMVYEDYFGQ